MRQSRERLGISVLFVFAFSGTSCAFVLRHAPVEVARRRQSCSRCTSIAKALSSKPTEFLEKGSADAESKVEGYKPRNLWETLSEFLRVAFKSLTQLSLEDYKWRSSVFKETEANRRLEESIARMLGEDASYVRPMDASDKKIGPLGRWERNAVAWVSQVIEEEGKRAETILESDGAMVRPIDVSNQTGDDDLGPLAFLEKKAVDFINSIRDSEQERALTKTMRPKDMEESKRGPLGELEARAVAAWREIQESELLRYEQSQRRGGEVVRPIDVPGPLGEIEMAVADIFRAEQQRAKEERQEGGFTLIRPKDATLKGPLGEAELGAVKGLTRLTEEERERLRNIQRMLQEKRPMEQERDSPLGIFEAFVVGIFRAPQLLMSVLERVKELMKSEMLEASDQERINTSYDVDQATEGANEGNAPGSTL